MILYKFQKEVCVNFCNTENNSVKYSCTLILVTNLYIMLDFLVFVTYIMGVKQVTFTEAKIEAVNVCQNLYWTPYSRDERVQAICNEVWDITYPKF